MSNWFENHQPQRIQISSVVNAPFIQNSNQMASMLAATASFPSLFFRLQQYSDIQYSFRLRQMAFFVFAKDSKGRLSSNWERFWTKKKKAEVVLWTDARLHGIYLWNETIQKY